MVEEPDPVFGDGDDGDEGGSKTVDADDVDGRPGTRKLYVDNGPVWITAEAIYNLDADTQRLRLVEYRDFVSDTVRSLFPDPHELRSRWANRVGRPEIVDALAAYGIEPEELLERTGLTTADPIDVLVHIAWNQPLATRTDRVRRVRAEHQDFFDTYQPAARDVLNGLLDKSHRARNRSA